MKKIISILLMMALMLAGFTACGGKKGEEAPADEPSVQEPVKEPKVDTLVVYFSMTGKTEVVANLIADATQADVHKIIPDEEYTPEDIDYGDGTRAKKEQDDPDCRPALSSDNFDMSQYTTIFIGYPIWYGYEPRIIDTFVELYDFEGKTVIPFCTSDSTGIEDSEASIKEKAGGGEWKDGKRFEPGASAEDIQSWIDSLELK